MQGQELCSDSCKAGLGPINAHQPVDPPLLTWVNAGPEDFACFQMLRSHLRQADLWVDPSAKRFSLPPKRYFHRQSLAPFGEISTYKPPP